MHIKNLKNHVPLLILLTISGLLYFLSLAPSVVQIDSGELAAVQSILGIAHPTGYPLFTLLGHLFLMIPLFHSPIYQLNFLSLTSCIFGVFFIGTSIKMALSPQMLKISNCLHNSPSTQTKSPFIICQIAMLIGTSYLVLSPTYWSLATSVEVYSLQALLMGLILYCSIRALNNRIPSVIPWFWVAISLGFGFTNHMTTIIIFPGIIFLFIKNFTKQKIPIKQTFLLILLICIIYGTIYLYLPLRAMQDPPVNWGNPINLKNLIRHVTGKQYQVWMFSSVDTGLENIIQFFKNLPHEWTLIGLIISLAGCFFSISIKHPLMLFILLNGLLTILYAANYKIHDIQSYYLLFYFSLAVETAFGTYWILKILKNKWLQIIFISILLINTIIHGVNSYCKSNLNDLWIYHDYTKQALNSLPKNSLLLSYQWDILISPSFYFQYVENYRQDVVIIDKELLRRSWYYKQLTRNYPDVTKSIQFEMKIFLATLKPFEEGKPYNPYDIEKSYRKLISRMIEESMDSRNVFIAPELVEGEIRKGELYLPDGVFLIPDLFFFRAVKSKKYSPLHNNHIDIRSTYHKNTYTEQVNTFISHMLVWRSLYEIQYQKFENAKLYKRILKAYYPKVPLPKQLELLE